MFNNQGRIQEFIGGGGNRVLQSKVIGEARIDGAKRPRIESETQTEGEARVKTGDGSREGMSPSSNFFLKNRT